MKFYRENNINPASSCLPLVAQFPIFIGLYYTLRHFAKHGRPPARRPLVAALRPNIAAAGDRALVGLRLLAVYVASQLASTYFMSGTMQQVAAEIIMVLPFVVHLRRSQLPRRPGPLLDDDEPLDCRAGADHPQAHSKGRPPPPGRNGRREPPPKKARREAAAPAAAPAPKGRHAAAPRETQEEEHARLSGALRSRRAGKPSARPSGRPCGSSSVSDRGSTSRLCASRSSRRASAGSSVSASRRPG